MRLGYTSHALGGASKVSPVLHSARTLRVRQRPTGRECRTGLFVCGDTMQEVWKAVPGYEGAYEVSDQGRVRNASGRVLKLCNVSGGYKAVSLGRNNSKTIHRLVAAAFIGQAPEGKKLVLHGNGDRTDNRVENLRYGNHKDNVVDAIRHGTQVRGERQHAAKLTIEQVREILSRKESVVTYAKRFNVTCQCICLILKRKNWRHV